MKKLFVSALVITLFAGAASAQTTTPSHKEKQKTTTTTTKSKPTASVPEKMHNAIHPNHQKHSGMKTKQKTSK